MFLSQKLSLLKSAINLNGLEKDFVPFEKIKLKNSSLLNVPMFVLLETFPGALKDSVVSETTFEPYGTPTTLESFYIFEVFTH
uniref:Uncharacterized protein n=1 Tax=Strongyloides venezuelensis TaxID=75913 RepID=A0A0K0G5A3_STRVS